MSYRDFFKRATGHWPYPYQERLATAADLPDLLSVPTGLGKTAAVVVAWLWRRRAAPEELRLRTPRRLVYCLPMRVLVEQTHACVVSWLERLGWTDGVRVAVLMGGEESDEWDLYPEDDAILIGTQDMLLSRALNRGYGASRYRWPIQFGLLHTDCLWVYDEVQLMGAGLATSAQLAAFRRCLAARGSDPGRSGDRCHSLWMSATLQRDWLRTVDFDGEVESLALHELGPEDAKVPEAAKRLQATKRLEQARARLGDIRALAEEVLEAHRPGSRTIVVVNTVRRARDLFAELSKRLVRTQGPQRSRRRRARNGAVMVPGTQSGPHLVLLHSRFRPSDRRRQIDAALAPVDGGGPGTIVVSTQVIEAGVDVTSTTLFTEIAPWASLVQRFGRCNRAGEAGEDALVRWIGVPPETDISADLARPYDPEDLKASDAKLRALKDVRAEFVAAEGLAPAWRDADVIRWKDLVDLFDTTPDLAGNDIDVDRFVREAEESDVRVYWRHWVGARPPADEPTPRREELCAAPVSEVRAFLATERARGMVFRRDHLRGDWSPADPGAVYPGQTLLVHWRAGGYRPTEGWDVRSRAEVPPPEGMVPAEAGVKAWDAYEERLRQGARDVEDYDDDHLSESPCWQTIAEHTDDVCRTLDRILGDLGLSGPEAECARLAARWHDWGKSHPVFQDAVREEGRPARWRGCRVVAKAPGRRPGAGGAGAAVQNFWCRYGRPHFRHELASALGVLQPGVVDTTVLDQALRESSEDPAPAALLTDATSWEPGRDLVAYLTASHHGKVRLSIRSLPNETWGPSSPGGGAAPARRFARGVWEGDELPSVELGGGVVAPAVTLSLEPMELGLCADPPFTGQPSWLERMIRLRDLLGPFRLAFWEALVRAADMRASAVATSRMGSDVRGSVREVAHGHGD
ncbi:MAG TPA: DEAD/DEAH box helicase [Gemmatimonadales bacterium]|nr:DEAD/DEAH box helicase [Gemmatimonadales bacterium]